MYIIEGNIGAGKSTFVKLIGEHIPQINTALEPLNNWQKQVYGQSLLTNFYQNTKRWAYTLETLTMICRAREHINLQKQDSITHIAERSLYSGHYCFALNSYEQGFMSALEWEIYLQWFSWLVHNKCQVPNGFIYLRVDPSIAYERIKKRNRHAEKTISLGYLKQIHEKHEQFLVKKKDLLPGLDQVPVLILDCNKEFASDLEQLSKHMEQVKQFVNNPLNHKEPQWQKSI